MGKSDADTSEVGKPREEEDSIIRSQKTKVPEESACNSLYTGKVDSHISNFEMFVRARPSNHVTSIPHPNNTNRLNLI